MILRMPEAESRETLDRREKAFELDLAAFVCGRDVRDEDFAERTRLATLSADQATLWLRSPVRIGTKLIVRLSVPRTDLLEKPLHMALSGTVSEVPSAAPAARADRLIVLRLDKNFRISPFPA